MARIFITGSSEGLGLMAGQLLAEQGHRVVLHARNTERARVARAALPTADAVVEGDVSTIAGAEAVAAQADALGAFDAVIHNVGIGYREPKRIETADGLPHVFAVNVLAPYLLTALMRRPKRLVYLSSGMQHGVNPRLGDLLWEQRRRDGATAYAESKLYDTVLPFAVARRWPDVLATALEPGRVLTRMGGARPPDDMDKAHRTQAWLAVSEDAAVTVSGRYFYHQRERAANPAASDTEVQNALVERCAILSGVTLQAEPEPQFARVQSGKFACGFEPGKIGAWSSVPRPTRWGEFLFTSAISRADQRPGSEL